MNMPKRASRNQAMRASRWAGVSVSWMAGTGWSEDWGMGLLSCSWARDRVVTTIREATGSMRRRFFTTCPWTGVPASEL